VIRYRAAGGEQVGDDLHAAQHSAGTPAKGRKTEVCEN
jgi:hypothetical protein